jgi:hypothetical protein
MRRSFVASPSSSEGLPLWLSAAWYAENNGAGLAVRHHDHWWEARCVSRGRSPSGTRGDCAAATALDCYPIWHPTARDQTVLGGTAALTAARIAAKLVTKRDWAICRGPRGRVFEVFFDRSATHPRSARWLPSDLRDGSQGLSAGARLVRQRPTNAKGRAGRPAGPPGRLFRHARAGPRRSDPGLGA